MAGTTFLRYWTDLDLITIILLPVFLFSGTFYPISVYPPVLQAIVWVSPLFHGTEIIRALMLGAIEPVILVHVAILVAYTLVGFWICARRLDILLVK
jgi:lipooligosaccharide transport system permease protein